MPISRPWPVFRSLAGYAPRYLSGDLVAGLTLAAIAVPEQMATARLGGFSPEFGFFAFAAGCIGFAVFGANRFLSVGADSTITPIFAGGLVGLAAVQTADYGALAALLALIVGAALICGGIFRLGWIADLLSVPVTTGFLAGIAGHIAVSQLPQILGIAAPAGSLVHQIATIASALPQTNPYALAIGLGVFGVTLMAERISAKIPGALIGLAGASAAVILFHLESRGVTVLGPVASGLPKIALPAIPFADILQILPLALIVTMIVMVQTAATTRSFSTDDDPPDVNRDFLGVGAGNILAGFFSAFPVNASPPRTAIIAETGGRSQLSGLVAAAIVLGMALFGGTLLAHLPHAALAGILLFVAQRIVRLATIMDVYRQSLGEFLLIVVTMAAIVVMPIEIGAATGIALSLLHGIWTTTRAHVMEFVQLPGTSIWWPPGTKAKGETVPGVVVVAFQAPLSFLNAYDFKSEILSVTEQRADPLRLVVLEASSIVEIDYTAAKILTALIEHYHQSGVLFAISRLESVRAQEAFQRFGLMTLLGEDRLFHSVNEAVQSLAGPSDSPVPPKG